MDDNYEGPTCPKCGSDDVEWETCWQCHGEGEFDLHDEDGVNYAEGEEYERCEECRGRGGYQVCHACVRASQERCGEPMPPEKPEVIATFVFPTNGYVPDVRAAYEHLQRLFDACGDGSGKLDAGWVMTVATKAMEALSEGIKGEDDNGDE